MLVVLAPESQRRSLHAIHHASAAGAVFAGALCGDSAVRDPDVAGRSAHNGFCDLYAILRWNLLPACPAKARRELFLCMDHLSILRKDRDYDYDSQYWHDIGS